MIIVHGRFSVTLDGPVARGRSWRSSRNGANRAICPDAVRSRQIERTPDTQRYAGVGHSECDPRESTWVRINLGQNQPGSEENRSEESDILPNEDEQTNKETEEEKE